MRCTLKKLLIKFVVSGGLLFLSAVSSLASQPVLHFSDITSGPKTGNTDGAGGLEASQHGAIVTIWGNRLGVGQEDSNVFFKDSGGTEHTAAHIYYWVNADGRSGGGPSDLYYYHKMQEIAFSIPPGVTDGLGSIYVKVDGSVSNELAFTVRDGNIYFINSTGDNSKTGTYDEPWGAFETNGHGTIESGDILYVTGDYSSTGYEGLRIHGKANPVERPIAIIAYPHATVYLDGTSSGIRVWSADPYPEYWVFSKMKINTEGTGVSSIKGMRAIGLEITGPKAKGQSGAISGAGDSTGGVKCFGNYIHDFGLNDYSIRLHHVFYLSNRDGTPNESYELGWNYLKDNHARGGLHIYDEGSGGDFTGIMKIHDNVVVNQSGPGFAIAAGTDDNFTMPVNVYNNLFINCGLNPFPSAAITAVKPGVKSHVSFYNNIIYGYGEEGSTDEAIYVQTGGSQDWAFGGTWEWINNIVIDTKNLPYEDPVYADIPDSYGNNVWYSIAGSTHPVPTWNTDSIMSDPLFADPEQGDFRLKSGSPCIDAGAELLSVAARDFHGKNRGDSFDIGALEYSDDVTPDDGGGADNNGDADDDGGSDDGGNADNAGNDNNDSDDSGNCFIGSIF